MIPRTLRLALRALLELPGLIERVSFLEDVCAAQQAQIEEVHALAREVNVVGER